MTWQISGEEVGTVTKEQIYGSGRGTLIISLDLLFLCPHPPHRHHDTGWEWARGSCLMPPAGRWCRNRGECASLLLGVIIRPGSQRCSAYLPARSSLLLIRLLSRRLALGKHRERKERLSVKKKRRRKKHVTRGPLANVNRFGGWWFIISYKRKKEKEKGRKKSGIQRINFQHFWFTGPIL